MAYASIDIQQPGVDGAVITTETLASGVGDGAAVRNSGNVFLMLANTGVTGDATFTIKTGATVKGNDVADVEITVGTETEQVAGPFPRYPYNQPGGVDLGKIQVEVSGVGAADGEIGAFG